MAFIFQILDDDLNLVADLHDYTGANNLHGLRTQSFEVDLGVPEFARTYFEGEAPGGSLVRERDGLATMSFKLGTIGVTDSDTYRAGVNALISALRNNSIFKVQMTALSDVLYIDYISADFAALLRGQSIGVVKTASQLHDPEGMPIACRRQPYIRNAVLSSATNVLVNATLLRDADGNGRPDSWTVSPSPATEEIEASTGTYKATITNTTPVFLDSFANGTVAASPGQVWTAAVDSDLSGVAQITTNIKFWNASNVQIQSSGSALTGATRRSHTATAPALTARVSMHVTMVNSGVGTGTYRLKNAQLELASSASSFVTDGVAVSNDPTSRTFPVYIHGSAPAAPIVTWTVDGGNLTEIVVAKHASLMGENLPDYRNTRKFLQCESGTLGADTSSTADTDASGGNCAQTTGEASLQKRVTHSLSTLLTSLKGTWDVWVRVKPTAASVWSLQLRHGEGSANHVEDPVPLTNTATSWDYVDVYLGRMSFSDSTLAGIVLELWGRRVSGTGNLRWDAVSLAPVDEPSSVVAKITAPWGSRVLYPGKDLIKTTNPDGTGIGSPAAVQADGSLRFSQVTNGNYRAGPAPAAGLSYATNRLRATFDIEITGNHAGVIYIRNVTDSTDVVSAAISTVGRRQVSLEIDAVSGKLYQPQLRVDSGSSGFIFLHSITTEQTIPVTTGQKVRWDSERMVAEHLDTSGNVLRPLSVIGATGLWLEPGPDLIYMHYGDLPLVGFDRNRSILTRAPVVSYTYRPRDLV